MSRHGPPVECCAEFQKCAEVDMKGLQGYCDEAWPAVEVQPPGGRAEEPPRGCGGLARRPGHVTGTKPRPRRWGNVPGVSIPA